MKGSSKLLFFFSTGAMEIIWLYLLSAPFFLLVEAPLFPLRGALLTFVLAFFLTTALKGRGCRIIAHLALHLVLCLAAALWTLYLYEAGSGSFFSGEWLTGLLNRQYGLREGYILFLVLFWVIAFWAGALARARRSSAYKKVTARFDLGITLILIALILAGVGGVSIPHGGPLIIAYFIFSMISIALAKSMEGSDTGYLLRFRHLGPVLVFAAFVLLLGMGSVLLFLPVLTSAAELGYRALQDASGPLGAILTGVLLFIFGGARRVAVDGGSSPGFFGAEGPAAEPSFWTPVIERLLGWGTAALLVPVLLAAAGWGIYRFLLWLFSRTAADKAKNSLWAEIGLWFGRLAFLWKRIVSKACRIVQNITGREQSAATFFLKLSGWGRSCGFSRRAGETPREYGVSLSSCFPFGRTEISLIVEQFCRETYGNKTLEQKQLHRLKKAWRRLRSPLNWPLRLRYKLFPHQTTSEQQGL